jgi:hypothetical protein
MKMISNAECMAYFGIEKSDLIPGLTYIPSALSPKACDELISMIEANNWFMNGNQMIFFGNLPEWLDPIYEIGVRMLPEIKRMPLFDQCIANSYENSQGINDHIDLLKFEDGILIVSISGTCTMDFKKNDEIVSFFLRSGDAISLSGEARYEWKHGIPERQVDYDDDGQLVKRTHRISITLRSLMKD